MDAGAGATPHLVVDARMARHSGIGRYIREVVPRVAALRPEWRLTLLGDPAHAPLFAGLPAHAQWVTCTAPIYSVAEQVAIPRAVPRDASLLWVPHYNIPLAWRGPLAVTVHDVFHLADPQGGALRKAYARTLLGAVRRRASAILCDSEFTRRELRERSGASRIDPVVAHLGVGAEWGMDAASPGGPLHPRPYALFVGNVKPHKNLSTLLEAFARIRDRVPHDLVVVGKMDGMRTVDRASQAAAASLGDRVRFAGEVSDAELRRWVRGASLFVLPSRYEGFGLPPLEAMAAGVACLVSTGGSLPEVCGGGAELCDPDSAEQMGEQLAALLLDDARRADLAERGRAHAAQFTWERTAEQTAGVLARAMAGAGRLA